GQGAERCAGPDDPAPEAGMDVSHRMGKDMFFEIPVRLLGAFRRAWCRPVKASPQLGGDGAPDRAVTNGPEIVHQVVHHAVAESAKLVPVLRVEGLFGSEGLGCSHGAFLRPGPATVSQTSVNGER